MYYYIVDPQEMNQSDFERVQNQLYSSVSEFRVSGETARATGVRTVTQLVENALSREVKTIIAVGGDDTLQEVINAVGNREVMIGFVPIRDSKIGELLGLKTIEQSVKTLAARRFAEMDLGTINGNLFFTKLEFGSIPQPKSGWFSGLNYKFIQNLAHIPSIDLKFHADDKYEVQLPVVGGVIDNITNPIDGKFDVLLLPPQDSWSTFKYRNEILNNDFAKIPGVSILHVKKLEITWPESVPVKTEGRIISKTPSIIEIQPKALKIIVGKERKF